MSAAIRIVRVVVALAIVALVAPVVLGPFVIWAAWVQWTLWGWFAVPAGAPALGFWHMVGIATLVRTFTHVRHAEPEKKPEATKSERIVEGMVYGFGAPLVWLGVGAAIHEWGMP